MELSNSNFFRCNKVNFSDGFAWRVFFKKADSYFIDYVKKDEVKKLKEKFDAPIPSVSVEASTYIPIPPKVILTKEEKEQIAEKFFFENLSDDSYYVVDTFSVKLFSEIGEELNLKSNFLAKFFIVNKPFQIKNPLIEDYKFFEFEDDFCLLYTLPKISYRDKRVCFDNSYSYGKEVTFAEIKRILPSIVNYGYELEIKTVKEIKKSEAEKIIKDVAKEVLIHKQKMRELFEEVTSKEAVQLTKVEVEYLLGRGRIVAAQRNYHSVENKLLGIIDRCILRSKNFDSSFAVANASL